METEQSQPVSVLLAVRQSFLAFVTMVGVICWLIAILLSEYVLASMTNGVLAGMFAIWGTSAFAYAAIGRVGLRLINYN